jgi:hypothetical protein
MRVKKIMLGLVAGSAIAVAAAFVPGKQAVAEDGFTCITKKFGTECGCPSCMIKNCNCPPPADSEEGGGSEVAN